MTWTDAQLSAFRQWWDSCKSGPTQRLRVVPAETISRLFLAGHSIEVLATMYALDRDQVEDALRGRP